MRIAIGTILLGLTLLPGPAAGQPAKDTSISDRTFDGKSLTRWQAQMRDQDASKREQAVMALLHFEKGTSKIIPTLLDLTHDPDVSVRAKACLVLRYVEVDGESAPKVVKALMMRLNRISPNIEYQSLVRYEAAVSLGRFVSDATPAIPYLLQGLHDPASFAIRKVSASVLWHIGMEGGKASPNGKSGPDDRIVNGFLDWMRNEKTFIVKLEMLQGLGAMGRPANQGVLSRLIKDLYLFAGARTNEDNKALRIWAYTALVQVTDDAQSQANLTAIAKYLGKDYTLDTRAHAAQALGALGPVAKKKVPALLAMLDDKEALAVAGACFALGRIGDKSDKVVDALLKLIENKQKDPALAAPGVKALVDLQLNSARVITKLDKMRDNKDLNIGLRYWIEDAVKEMKKPKK